MVVVATAAAANDDDDDEVKNLQEMGLFSRFQGVRVPFERQGKTGNKLSWLQQISPWDLWGTGRMILS